MIEEFEKLSDVDKFRLVCWLFSTKWKVINWVDEKYDVDFIKMVEIGKENDDEFVEVLDKISEMSMK